MSFINGEKWCKLNFPFAKKKKTFELRKEKKNRAREIREKKKKKDEKKRKNKILKTIESFLSELLQRCIFKVEDRQKQSTNKRS